MDVARLGLAHDSLDGQLERHALIRKIAAEVDRNVGIMVDLPGPKVRAGRFPEGGALLETDALLRLTPGDNASTAEVVEISYDGLLTDVHPGDRVTFGDGGIVIEVTEREGDALVARVIHGGLAQGRPGLHVPAERLQLSSPTPDDMRMLDAFVEAGTDFIALSYIRSAHDVRRVGTEPHPNGPLIVAKIETRPAVENLEGIIQASGAVMVARGDLGSECSIEDLPHLQKDIIRKCIALGRPAITATQMLESMVHAPTPTRAEAGDVANAIFDGSSAVMLSGETAIGHDPVNVVGTMARIAERADQEFDHDGWAHDLTRLRMTNTETQNDAITDAMTIAAWRATNELKVAAILCVSRTGHTVRSMARFRPSAPIIGVSADERTRRQLSMSWGADVLPTSAERSNDEMVTAALHAATADGKVRTGDLVAVLGGATSESGATDVLRLVRVP